MTRRISVRAIILHEGKLLCVKHKKYENNILQATEWCLPGGGLDDEEDLRAGIEREMVEETGIKPSIGELLYIQQFTLADKDFLEFFFHVTNAVDYLNVDLASSTHGALEIAEIAFIDPKTTKILPKFLTTEPLVDQAAQPSPTKIFSYL